MSRIKEMTIVTSTFSVFLGILLGFFIASLEDNSSERVEVLQNMISQRDSVNNQNKKVIGEQSRMLIYIQTNYFLIDRKDKYHVLSKYKFNNEETIIHP